MQIQRFALAQGAPSYTVVDENGLPVAHIEAFLRYERQVASPNTVKAYARAIVRWHNFLHTNTTRDWDTFTPSNFGDFARFLETGNTLYVANTSPENMRWLAPASVQQHLAATVAFYRWHMDEHGAEDLYYRIISKSRSLSRRRNATGSYQGFMTGLHEKKTASWRYTVRTGNKTRPPVLSPSEIVRILEISNQRSNNRLVQTRNALLIRVLWETGMRIGEVLNLQHQDMNTGQGSTPWVEVIGRQEHPHGARGKRDSHRRIYISDELEKDYSNYLWELIDAGIDLDIPNLGAHFIFVNVAHQPLWSPMRVETVNQIINSIRGKDSTLPKFSPHWFRHTHATTLLMAGVQPHVVMRRLGHADIQTTLNTYGWVTADTEIKAWEGWQKVTDDWRGIST